MWEPLDIMRVMKTPLRRKSWVGFHAPSTLKALWPIYCLCPMSLYFG